VEACLRQDAVSFLIRLLEKEKLDHLVDSSAAKVHSVTILKVLENDVVHGPACAAQLAAAHGESWDKYKYQKHDLFLSKNDTRDYFLTDVATAPSFLLKNQSEWGSEGAGASAPSSSGGSAVPSSPLYSDAPTSPTATVYSPPAAAAYVAPVNPFAGAPAPAPAAPPVAPSGADPFADLLG
jgi:hypothetical protein